MAGLEADDPDNDPYITFTFVQNGIISHEIDGRETTGIVHYQHNQKVPQHWILLDNQSTVDVFSNKRLLKNI